MVDHDVHDAPQLRPWRLTPANEAASRQALVLGSAPKKSGSTDRRVIIAQPIVASATITAQTTNALGVTY